MNVRLLNPLLLTLISTVALARSNPAPLINQPLVPDSVKPGHKAFTLTVNGTGFTRGALVYWNGSSRVTQFVSSGRLKAIINAADVAKAGTASITVSNLAKGKAVSNVVYFPVRRPSPSVAFTRGTNFLDYGEAVVGDFNNDGKPDVAMCSSAIEVFLGNGDGTFQPAITTDAQTTLDYVITADFNGDGNLDLVGSDGNGGVYVFLGQGNGKFIALQPFYGFDNGRWLAAADFNRDGKIDLYFDGVDSNGGWFLIYPGNGDGTFSRPIRGIAGESVGAPAIGDFNHDGNLDLAIADGSDIDVALGNGDGSFGSFVGYPAGVGNRGIGFVATADLNHDGALDLVTDGVCVLFGDGGGGFTNQGCIDVGGNSPALSIGDFNADGELDVAAFPVTDSGDFLAILLGREGQLQKPIELQICDGGCQSLFGVADFDNDGGLDIATGSDGHVYFQAPASLAPPTLDFGNRQVGTSSQLNATLTNLGSSKLSIESIKITGLDPRDFSQTNNCGKSLPPGGSCKIEVIFKPKQQGARSASLSVAYKGLGSPQTVALSGVGVSLTVSLTPSKLRFPTQVINTTSSPRR